MKVASGVPSFIIGTRSGGQGGFLPRPTVAGEATVRFRRRGPSSARGEVAGSQLSAAWLLAGSFECSHGFGGRSCVFPCRGQFAQETGKLAQRRQAPVKKNDRAYVNRDKQRRNDDSCI
jgi:hypothetical protein